MLGSASLGSATPSLILNATAEMDGFSPLATPSIAAGDLNGDGNVDLVAIDPDDFGGAVEFFLGNGDGTFPSLSYLLPGGDPTDIAVGDFNNDGKLDVAVTMAGNNTVAIFLGNGDGTFVQVSQSPATGNCPADIEVADFNGDGFLDLAVVNSCDNTISILLGNGDGTFTPKPNPTGGVSSISFGPIAVGDFNGDGIPDLATAGNNTVTVLIGNGDGSFTPAAQGPLQVEGPTGIAAGDFNGDGKLDLAVSEANGQLTALIGDGKGNFVPVVSPDIPAGNVKTGDFNADGKLDLAVGALIALGNGEGTFMPAITAPGHAADDTAVADFNGDGVADLAFTHAGCLSMCAPPNYSPGISVNITSLTQTAMATATGIDVPGQGTHAVSASYAGDANVAPSVSTTTISLTGSASPWTPLFAPPGGTYHSAQTVTISDATAGATIYYTTDGSTPTANSPVYTAPISIQTTMTLSAIASAGGLSASPVTSATYTIEIPTFAISATSLTLLVGGSGPSTVTVGSSNSYAGTVSLSCTVTSSPAGAVHLPTCSSGQTVMLDSSVTNGTAAVQVSTTPASTSSLTLPNVNGRRRLLLGGASATLAFIVLLWVPRTKRKWWADLSTFIVVAILASVFATGCGSNNRSSSVVTPGTTAGTYVITVTATGNDSSKATASTTFNLTVQ